MIVFIIITIIKISIIIKDSLKALKQSDIYIFIMTTYSVYIYEF